MDTPFDTVVLNALLARAQAGDSAARDDLLRRCSRRLELLTRKMLRDFPAVRRWEETGDVFQNAAVRLVRALNAVTPTSTREFFGLAAEQIRRELVDLARHYRGPEGLDRNLANAPTPDLSSQAAFDPPARTVDDLDRWTTFHEAVHRLPSEEREVFMLTFYHGWKQADIAALFQVDERTIRRRWQAASVRLGEQLGGRLPGS
ncbi:MAG TPA: sigma-70 family RNA polymerase sigma factor [Gemmataceae bacterium]|jgi:RNA polymerase sigma-70 factor (ECF subfamily)|nr:sigma-70 family RNA polymerase sigma factor [Gemmataceae bacterium]